MRQSTYLRKALRALAADGWRLVLGNDGDRVQNVTTERKAMALARSVDCGHLHFEHDTKGKGWLFFVWQGPDSGPQEYDNGAEIVSDYTVNMEPALEQLWEKYGR